MIRELPERNMNEHPNLQVFFPGDSYDTPDDADHPIRDRLFPNTRLYFIGGYIREVFRSRSLAGRNLYDRKAWVASSYRMLKLIERCGGRFHLRGLENLISCRPPLVIVSNHMSVLETFVFPCIIAPLFEVTFVVKESLVTHPLFGPVMRSREPIAVKRENPRQDLRVVLSRGRELLTKGISIIIFPESTRSAEFRPASFNSLGIKLAKSAGVQAMPVAVKTDFWENGKYLKDLGTIVPGRPIHMAFGRPFSIDGTGKDEHQRIIDFIVSHLREWGGRIENRRDDRNRE